LTDVGIFTHESRVDVLAKTLDALARHNIEPRCITTDSGIGTQIKNRLNAIAALEGTYRGNPVLLLEDDVIAGDYLPEWLAYLEANVDEVVCLLTMRPHFYSERTEVELRNRKPIRNSRLEVNPRLSSWWGTQAVWLPPRIIEGILADRRFRSQQRDPLGPWDHSLRHVMQEDGERMLMAFPAVFEHQSPPSVVNRQNRRTKRAAAFKPDAQPPAEKE